MNIDIYTLSDILTKDFSELIWVSSMKDVNRYAVIGILEDKVVCGRRSLLEVLEYIDSEINKEKYSKIKIFLDIEATAKRLKTLEELKKFLIDNCMAAAKGL